METTNKDVIKDTFPDYDKDVKYITQAFNRFLFPVNVKHMLTNWYAPDKIQEGIIIINYANQELSDESYLFLLYRDETTNRIKVIETLHIPQTRDLPEDYEHSEHETQFDAITQFVKYIVDMQVQKELEILQMNCYQDFSEYM